MLKEFVRFTKKRPINGLTLAVVGLYAGSKVLNAFKAPEGQFWNEPVKGIGASTSTTTSSSSSHRLNPHCHCGGSMGVGGHCNNPGCNSLSGLGASMSSTSSTSSSHGHKRESSYGEDTYKSPMTLMGVPSAVKRRVMVNDMGDDDGFYTPQNSHLFGHQQAQQEMSEAEIMEIAGAGGWM